MQLWVQFRLHLCLIHLRAVKLQQWTDHQLPSSCEFQYLAFRKWFLETTDLINIKETLKASWFVARWKSHRRRDIHLIDTRSSQKGRSPCARFCLMCRCTYVYPYLLTDALPPVAKMAVICTHLVLSRLQHNKRVVLSHWQPLNLLYTKMLSNQLAVVFFSGGRLLGQYCDEHTTEPPQAFSTFLE